MYGTMGPRFRGDDSYGYTRHVPRHDRNHSPYLPDLAALLAKATPLRSGDMLAGIAAASGEERVAAQVALADLPLRTFLNEQVVPYETDEVTRLIIDSHDANAFAPDCASDGGRIARLASLRCGDDRNPRRARARHHARDGGGGEQDQPPAGPDGDGGEMLGRHPLPQHHRAPRPPLGAAAAQSSDRRSHRHCGEHSRRPAARLRRRRHRHQPRDRQSRARPCAPVDARGRARQARHPDARLRAGACDHHARAHRQELAGRSRVPVDRRHAGRQQELRHRPRAARRSPRRRAGAQARHGRRQRDVFRDRARQRALRRGPSRRRPADARGARLRGGADIPAAPGQHRGGLHRAGISLRRQADHPRRARGSFLRQAHGPADGLATSATPITPRPTRTTWTRCSRCWPPRASTT